MTKYIVLLRGINVGGNNKVPMKILKKVFEDISFQNVLTYINSGNIIFETKEQNKSLLKNKIEKELLKEFNFEIKIVLRDYKNIENLYKKIPKNYENNDEQKTDILFLWEDFDKKESLNLIKINKEVDNLEYIDGAIIWNVDRKKYSKSGMNKFIGTQVYKNMTARNVNTVRKIYELMK
jgi:uncharacterized protein (DUF1697 family)